MVKVVLVVQQNDIGEDGMIPFQVLDRIPPLVSFGTVLELVDHNAFMGSRRRGIGLSQDGTEGSQKVLFQIAVAIAVMNFQFHAHDFSPLLGGDRYKIVT